MTLAYFIGDSLTSVLMAQTMSDRLGWTLRPTAPQNPPYDGTIDGIGGSGYLNAGSGTPFGDRLHYVLAAAPDVVAVIGGGNDTSLGDAEVIAAVQAFWIALRAGLPSAALYAAYLHRPPGAAKVAGLVASIAAAGGTYIDATGWITGTGYVGNEQHDGNADIYISADGVHPSAAGNVYLGTRIAFAISPYQSVRLEDGTALQTEAGGRVLLEVPA